MSDLFGAELVSMDWAASSQNAAPPVDESEAMLLGTGMDTFRMKKRNYPLQPTPVYASNQGQDTTYEVSRVKTTSELRRRIRLRASASYGGLFGSFSAKTRFARSIQENAYRGY